VIDDTCTPRWVADAITGLANARTMPAGTSVTSGASGARKATSKSAMINMTESSWMLPCEVLDCFCWSTKLGIVPVRWKLRPPGLPANVPRMVSTTVIAFAPPPNGGRLVTT